jgi:hypothetical protein
MHEAPGGWRCAYPPYIPYVIHRFFVSAFHSASNSGNAAFIT